ncbi:TrkH family potassium uptake protein [Mesobacillus maritimus]|uniref:TrkH family potassium uptake protein n=1 Tax=Mesobacillus maritimus TaxID=1643336 RepID=UPI00384B7A45
MGTFKKPKLDAPKILALGFVGIILVGTLLLSLPLATKDGLGMPFIDALFTATSATCVTGLVVVDTGETFTTFGQLVILGLIQIGGLGFMSIATMVAIILGRKVTLKERLLLQASWNNLTMGRIVLLVKEILLFTVIVQIAGAIILTIRFAKVWSLGKASYYGVFHAISNFNNAGFDLMGGFAGFTSYVSDPVVNITLMSLIICGGLGFIVLKELISYRVERQLSLHSKTVLSLSAGLILGGAILLFIFEYQNPKSLQLLSVEGKILGALYQSVSSRTAGSNTLIISEFTQTSILVILFLMFIGASPGSTGGGIKTTTFAVLISGIKAQIKGKADVTFFGRSLSPETLYKAWTVAASSLMFVLAVTVILTITEPGKDLLLLLFEATSAFATVGLSLGLTPELSVLGKIVIIITMYVGRLGPLTFALAVLLRKSENHYRLPPGKIMIG